MIQEFHITKSDIHRGIDQGALKKWSRRSCHGHSFLMLDRDEVALYAVTCPKDPELVVAAAKKALKEDIAAKTAELGNVTRELNGIDARKLWLIQRKAELESYLAEKNPSKSAKKRKSSE